MKIEAQVLDKTSSCSEGMCSLSKRQPQEADVNLFKELFAQDDVSTQNVSKSVPQASCSDGMCSLNKATTHEPAQNIHDLFTKNDVTPKNLGQSSNSSSCSDGMCSLSKANIDAPAQNIDDLFAENDFAPKNLRQSANSASCSDGMCSLSKAPHDADHISGTKDLQASVANDSSSFKVAANSNNNGATFEPLNPNASSGNNGASFADPGEQFRPNVAASNPSANIHDVSFAASTVTVEPENTAAEHFMALGKSHGYKQQVEQPISQGTSFFEGAPLTPRQDLPNSKDGLDPQIKTGQANPETINDRSKPTSMHNGQSKSEASMAAKDVYLTTQEPKNPLERGEMVMPSATSLLESLFANRTKETPQAPVAQNTQVQALVDKLVSRILVAEPTAGGQEIRLTLGDGVLKGGELSITRTSDGHLHVKLLCANDTAFQTAVQGRDELLNVSIHRLH